MSGLVKSKSSQPARSLAYEPAQPLWQRVPRHDEEGRRLSDFMMLIPRLKRRQPETIRAVLDSISAVLIQYEHVVMYADMNLKINTLWVTIRPVAGMCLEIPAAIKVAVPEALLVASREH